MTDSDQDRAVAAAEQAAEAVRALNHAAYGAEVTTGTVYARLGSLYALLTRTGQAVQVLREQATTLSGAPGLFSDDDTDPNAHGLAADALLRKAELAVREAHDAVNFAWNRWSHLGQSG